MEPLSKTVTQNTPSTGNQESDRRNQPGQGRDPGRSPEHQDANEQFRRRHGQKQTSQAGPRVEQLLGLAHIVVGFDSTVHVLPIGRTGRIGAATPANSPLGLGRDWDGAKQ